MTEDVFEFETEERGDTAVVRLSGELDLAEVAPLQAELDRLCSNGLSALTVDLRELDFVDSTGLHLLLRLRGDCERRQVGLQLVPGPPAVQRLFRITGTDVQFTFLESPQAPAPSVDDRRRLRHAGIARWTPSRPSSASCGAAWPSSRAPTARPRTRSTT